MADGFRLAGDPSSMDVGFYIKLVAGPGEIEGLHDDHLTGLPSEVLLQSPLIDHELALTRFQPDSGNGRLSLPCRINRFWHFLLLIVPKDNEQRPLLKRDR